MKTRDLCQALLQEACEENVAFYRQMIESEPLEAVRDAHWQKIIALARSLTEEQRELMLAFARQAAIDAVSTVCGGIDGSTQLGGQFVTLSLIDGDGVQHAGNLQDQFLATTERR